MKNFISNIYSRIVRLFGKNKCSPYCELCGNCGEDGCCSHLGCFRILVKNPKCHYGITYVRDATYASEMYELGFRMVEKLKDSSITKEQVIEEYHRESDLLYDKIYNSDEDNKK